MIRILKKKAEITEKLYSNLNEEGELDLESFAKEAFPAQDEAKEIFFSTLEKKKVLTNLRLPLPKKQSTEPLKKQRIKTDEGIEIKIPMDFYNNPQKMEFVTEPNGKISIIIKDINKIM